MKILVFDFEITGHHPEYLEHLVNYIKEEKNTGKNYYFVVHPDFCTKFPHIVQKVPAPKINFIAISNNELNILNKLKGNNTQYWDPFKIHDLLLKYAKIINPSICIIMYFNRLCKPLIWNKPNFDIRGILFSPVIHPPVKNNFVSILKFAKLRIIRFLYTRNKKIKKIFVLNDIYGAINLNKQIGKEVFFYLPDPIPVIEEEANFDIRKRFEIGRDRKILLHFGSLRESKGTIELIQALNLMSDEIASKCCLVIAGTPLNTQMETKVNDAVNNVKKVQIVYVNEFISNLKMKSFFNQCNMVVMPYKNALASSGVIGHAIIAGKPVISTQQGLIGEIIRTYWKGELIDRIEPEKIAKAIERSFFTVYPEIDTKNFIEEHTPFNFAKILLEDVQKFN